MNNIIAEAQYILDHPDELVSAKAYREIIEDLMELCRQSPDAWDTGALGRDERFVAVVNEETVAQALRFCSRNASKS